MASSLRVTCLLLSLYVCALFIVPSYQDPLPVKRTENDSNNKSFKVVKTNIITSQTETDLPYGLDRDLENDIPLNNGVFGSKPENDATLKGEEMDRLIYELVQEEKKDAVDNQFENTALKVIALKSKLDIRVDETLLALQNLKNLRHHIESAYSFANKFVQNKGTSEQIKKYAVTQLENTVKQVEETLNSYRLPSHGKPMART